MSTETERRARNRERQKRWRKGNAERLRLTRRIGTILIRRTGYADDIEELRDRTVKLVGPVYARELGRALTRRPAGKKSVTRHRRRKAKKAKGRG